MTLSIMGLTLTTHSIMALSIKPVNRITHSISALSIMALNMTTQHSGIMHKDTRYKITTLIIMVLSIKTLNITVNRCSRNFTIALVIVSKSVVAPYHRLLLRQINLKISILFITLNQQLLINN